MKEVTFEENTPAPVLNTPAAVWSTIWNNPSVLFRQWNYKTAIFSGLLRAPIFFVTYLQFAGRDANREETLWLAAGAAAAQFAYRFLFAGIIGSLIQLFRRVEPAWQALTIIMLLIPAISHLLEFVVQHFYAYLTGTTQHTDEAIIRSVCVSVISTLFNLFAMRRDVMIVGEAESKSMWSDIKRIPLIVAEFVAFIPVEVAKMLRRGDYIPALISYCGFGVFCQILGWAMFAKPYWTYNKGKTHWAALWGIDGLILLTAGIVVALIALHFQKKKA